MKISKFFPENKLKKKIRCFLYNRKCKEKIHISYKKNYYSYKLRNGVIIKSYINLIKNIEVFIKGYTKNYEIKEGNIIIDAGGYPGDFSIYASKLIGEKGKVIVFEPDESNYNKMIKNIELNNINNIIPIKKGLWSKDYNNFISLDNELERLDINKVDFIKMDIEGAEIEAIKGAKKTLKNNNINLAIASYHLVNGKKTCFEIERMLNRFGYKTETSFPEHLTTYGKKK